MTWARGRKGAGDAAAGFLRASLLGLVAMALAVASAASEDAAGPNAGRESAIHWPRLASGALQDNSFLIEEAYNQERGVIQHIFSAVRDRDAEEWVGTFTEEWPVFRQEHQFSTTIPWVASGEPGESSGVGDVLLNYRYQALFEDDGRPALAPRLSLLLPTGDHREGLGSGSVGVQINVPVSKQLSDHFAGHLNLGVTVIPDARSASHPSRGERLTSWNGGTSLIWEPVQAVNLLCEFVLSRDEELTEDGVTDRFRATVSPGVRAAWNGPGGVQWVVGAALPVGVTRDANDLGAFLYLSIEHAVTAAAQAESL